MDRRVIGGRNVGKVNGLAVGGSGEGALMYVQASAFPVIGRTGIWKATGIIEEEQMDAGARRMTRRSMASSALENVRTALRRRGIDTDQYDVHIDFPGGVPVDCPSAGAAMAAAVYSAITGQALDGSVAVTGEIGIDGEILPVGGVPEKICAAIQAGAAKVLIPRDNYEPAFKDMQAVARVDVLDDVLDQLMPQQADAQAAAVTVNAPSAAVLSAKKQDR